MRTSVPLVPLAEILQDRLSRPERVDPEKTYRILGAALVRRGTLCEGHLAGSQIRADKVFAEEGDFVYNDLFAWKGSFASRNRG